MTFPHLALNNLLFLKCKYPQSLGILLLWSCCMPLMAQSQYKKELSDKGVKPALNKINPETIKAHMSYLADDRLQGRKPGTPGFALASDYMEKQFRTLGLQPGVNGQTFVQEVIIRNARVQEAASYLKMQRTGQAPLLTYGKDYFLQPNLVNLQSKVTAPVVFVGYGVSAPELNYDDYAQVNVTGKIVMYLAGAPSSFPNNERAYFTSELAKQSTAAAKGAVGVITVVAADENQKTWGATLKRSRGGLNRWINPAGKVSNYFPELQVIGSVYQELAQQFFAGTNTTLIDAYKVLRSGKPASVVLPVTLDMQVSSQYTSLKTNNIVGILPGSDPVLKNEYVIYAAHIDHLGITAPVNGDSINNGAHDNASGSAILLETVRAFKNLPKAPKRSVIFLSCTGEEMGLIGSDYFANNPTVPATSLVANLALDMPFFFYPLQDIIPHGIQHSSLRGPVEATADYLDIKITPDPAPEEVVFTRSDHYSFIKKGIPALFIKGGIISGNPAVDGAKVIADWRKTIYHKVDDEMDQPFDFKAAAMHVKTNFLIGYLVANDPKRPTWNTGDFFGGKFGQVSK